MRAGTQVGPFRIVGELGRGGMGTVFAAEDARLHRTVALKLAHGTGADDVAARRRLLREARAAAAVSHPNIAAIYEVGEADGAVYIAMELVDGRPLRARLDDGPVPLAEAVRIGREIAAGLAHLHEAGIVHRDLKPENVLLDGDGRVRLVDFGIAKVQGGAIDDGTVTREGDLLGTPAYMSPEQAEGLAVDERSDIFSLGAVLHELVSGRRAFTGPSAMQVIASVLRDAPPPLPDVPGELARVIERCLEKLAADRFADVTQVADALALVPLDERRARPPADAAPPVPPAPPAPIGPTGPAARTGDRHHPLAVAATLPARARPRRWRWFALGGATLAAAALALLGLARRPARHAPPPTWQPVVAELPGVYDETIGHPALSPDGRRLAYLSDRRDRRRSTKIHVEPVRADDPVPATELPVASGTPRDLRWTADGTALLEAGPLGLFRVPLDGGAPVQLRAFSYTADVCGPRTLTAERDPTCEGCSRVVLFDDAGDTPVMAVGHLDAPRSVRCDAAGRRATIQLWRTEARRLDTFVVELDGVARPPGVPVQSVDSHRSAWPTIARTGDSVIATRGQGLESELVELSLDGRRERTLLARGNPVHPDVSRDGRVLAFVNSRSTWAITAQAAGAAPAPIATHYVWFHGLVITPDGRQLLATRVDRDTLAKEIYAYPVDGSAPSGRRIVDGRAWAVTAAGELIATRRLADDRTELFVLPLAGGEARRLSVLPSWPRDVRVPGDGRIHLTVAGHDGYQARSIAIAGGPLEADAAAPIVLAVPLASGHRIVEVGASEYASELRVVPPGEPLDSPRAHRLAVYTWVLGADAIFYRPPGEGALRRFDLATGRSEPLEFVQRYDDFAMSPDGRTFYTTADTGSSRPQLITNFGDRPPL